LVIHGSTKEGSEEAQLRNLLSPPRREEREDQAIAAFEVACFFLRALGAFVVLSSIRPSLRNSRLNDAASAASFTFHQ
jgi:hypothetical protein